MNDVTPDNIAEGEETQDETLGTMIIIAHLT